MKLKFKKLDKQAVIPQRANKYDAGLDLTAISINQTSNYIEYGTGLAVEIPDGYVGLLFTRSSVSKMDLVLANSVGVIDSGYRGEIKLRFKMINGNKQYIIGDRIGQLLIIKLPEIEVLEVDDLSDSDRGNGGFGSSGQ